MICIATIAIMPSPEPTEPSKNDARNLFRISFSSRRWSRVVNTKHGKKIANVITTYPANAYPPDIRQRSNDEWGRNKVSDCDAINEGSLCEPPLEKSGFDLYEWNGSVCSSEGEEPAMRPRTNTLGKVFWQYQERERSE